MNFDSLTKSVTLLVLGLAACSSLSAQTINNPIGCSSPRRPVHIYYIDPVRGSMNGNGSQTRPWSTLQAVLEAGLVNGQDTASGVVHAGDLIYLFTGNHGSITIDPWVGVKTLNTDFITIQAAPGNKPIINDLYMYVASKWVFRGLTIQAPLNSSGGGFLVNINYVDNVLFDCNTIYSVPNAVNWTPLDWAASSAFFGILVDTSTNVTISRNSISNVENGAYIGGNGILFTQNTIDYFANDGLDFSSSNTIISKNLIQNHYGQWNNGDHHDGIQGWTEYGQASATNVVIDRNYVVSSTGIYSTIPTVPTGVGDDILQGISIFDGVWSNVAVTNNVVLATGYHGLSLYGMTNATVENNTVIQQGGDQFGIWLGIFPSANGVQPVNVVVRNNIANSFNLNTTGVVYDHNLAFAMAGTACDPYIPIVNPSDVFVTYSMATATFNFNLCPGSPAIGAGSAVGTPTVDFTGKTRNPSSIDIGAYAY